MQVHHKAAVTLVRAEQQVYKTTSTDRVLQGFSLAFDASVEELWMAWVSGGALVVGTLEVMKSGPDLPTHIASMGVTCLSTVPTLLSTVPSSQLPTVRLLIVGGEACSRELANRWSEHCLFFNTYGPTEATVVTTVCQCSPNAPREARVTIGSKYHAQEARLLPPHAPARTLSDLALMR